jgi:hypothetical protein
MREGWTGFYGPAYQLMLKYADRDALPQTAWDEANRLHRDSPVGEGHWEFLALGYLHLFDREKTLAPQIASHLTDLVNLFAADHPTTNWRLMAQIVRCRVEGRFLASTDLDRVRVKQAIDGFLPDIRDDESTQYHAFILYLLLRFSDPSDAAMRSIAVRALDWLTALHNRYGDPSPLGRGRFQLFGYASMAAVAGQSERWQLPVQATWKASVWDRLEFVQLRGAISPKWDGPHRSHLLYGYNTADDYPAFAALLTHDLIAPKTKHAPDDGHTLWWHPLDEAGSGLVADWRGVLLSVLVSPHAAGSVGLRSLLRKALRRVEPPITRPQIVTPRQLLPGNNIRIREADGTLHLDWAIGDSTAQFSDITLWSPLQILVRVVTGSVEYASLEWRQPDHRVWFGLAIHASRVGKLEMHLRLP